MNDLDQAQEQQSSTISDISKSMSGLYLTGLAYSRIGDAKYAASRGIRYKGLPLGFRTIIGGTKDPSSNIIPRSRAFGLGVLGFAFGGPVGGIAGLAVGAWWRKGLLDITSENRHRNIGIAHGIDTELGLKSPMFYHPTEYTMTPSRLRYGDRSLLDDYGKRYDDDPRRIIREKVVGYEGKPEFEYAKKDGRNISVGVTNKGTDAYRKVYASIYDGLPSNKKNKPPISQYSYDNYLRSVLSRRSTNPYKYQFYKKELAGGSGSILRRITSIKHSTSGAGAVASDYRRMFTGYGSAEISARELGRFSVWDNFGKGGNVRFAFNMGKYKTILNRSTEEVRNYATGRFAGYDKLLSGEAITKTDITKPITNLKKRSMDVLGARYNRLYRQVQREGNAVGVSPDRIKEADRVKLFSKAGNEQSRTRVRAISEKLTAMREVLGKESDLSALNKSLDVVLKTMAANGDYAPSLDILEKQVNDAVKATGASETKAVERLVKRNEADLKHLARMHRASYLSKAGAGLLGVTTAFEVLGAAFNGMYKLGEVTSTAIDKMKRHEFGSGVSVQSQQASSERQRAVQAIGMNRMNASSFLGNEARRFS